MERNSTLTALQVKWDRVAVLWSFGIFAFALLMRLFSLNFIQPYGLGADENFYIETAQTYARGGSFTNQFFMPGWPWILSWFARIDDSVYFLRHCAAVLGSVSVLLVYHIGRRTLSENTGRVAALMLAVYPDHLMFSNLIQAEAALEMFTITATAFAFWTRPWRGRPERDMFSAAGFGAVLLVKHFAVISFAAFFASRIYMKNRLRAYAGVALCFLIPVILHGAYMSVTGRDPLSVFNSPLKSAGEWGPAGIRHANFTPGVNRLEKFKDHINWLTERPIRATTDSIRKNLFYLWSPGTFGVRRLLTDFYSISPAPWLAWTHAIFYLLIVVAGIFGMAFGVPTPFRRYAICSVVFLSCMSVAWYMVTRYRHPFEFLFFLYAADVIVQKRDYQAALLQAAPRRWAGWLAVTALFIYIFVQRVPHMASYQ